MKVKHRQNYGLTSVQVTPTMSFLQNLAHTKTARNHTLRTHRMTKLHRGAILFKIQIFVPHGDIVTFYNTETPSYEGIHKTFI